MKEYIKILGELYARKNGDIVARSHIEVVKLYLDGNVVIDDDNIIAHYDVLKYAEARDCTVRTAVDELKIYHDSLTDERSEPKGKFIDESEFRELSKHDHNCPCDNCMELNSINNVLTDTKRKYQLEKVLNETAKTSKESHEKVVEEALKAFFGNPIGRASVGEDSEFSKSCKESKSNASSDPKIRIVRYIKGSLLNELIEQSNSDELPSSEEPFSVKEVRIDSNRRSTPMDRRLPKDVSAMERFESAYAKYARHLQLGYINPRDFRELISHAFSEFMESVGQVSEGQTGLAV